MDYPPILQGHIQNDDTRFMVFTGPSQRHLKDILPHYLSGVLKEFLPIGYLFFLRSELLDFNAEQGDLEKAAGLTWHQFHSHYPNSPYIYTMCVKDFFDYFQQTVLNASYVMVLGYAGSKPDYETLKSRYQRAREGLNLDEAVHILACNIYDKKDCKRVLITLMDVIGDFPNREKVMPLIEAL